MIVHILFTPALNKDYETRCPEVIKSENRAPSEATDSETDSEPRDSEIDW